MNRETSIKSHVRLGALGVALLILAALALGPLVGFAWMLAPWG